MNLKKKMRSILAILLIMAMLLPSVVSANDFLKDEGKGKATMSLVYLKPKTGSSFPYEKTDPVTDLKEDDTFYVGVLVSGLSNVAEIEQSLFNVSCAIVYDNRYIQLEPDAGRLTTDTVTDCLKNNLNYAGSLTKSVFSYSVSAYNMNLSSYTDQGYATDDRALVFDMKYSGADPDEPDYNYSDFKQDEFYVAIVKVGIKAVPADGARVLRFQDQNLNGAIHMTIDFGNSEVTGCDSTHYEWNPTKSGFDMGRIMDLDISGVDIFPKVAGPVCDSGALQSEPIIYGDKASATFTGVKAAVDTGTLSYRWTVAATEDATTWTPVTDWASCTATGGSVTVEKQTIDKTDWGTGANANYIRCELKGATANAVASNAKQIKGRTLTAPATITTGVPTVKQDTTTKTANGTYTFVAADGLKGSDKVTVPYVVTYTDVAAAGPKSNLDVSFAGKNLSGTDAKYYLFDNSVTSTKATGEVVAKRVTKIEVKTPPTNTTYSVKGGAKPALDLTGLVVTITYDSGSPEDVALAGFAAKGIDTAPANGATLTAENNSVSVSFGGQSVSIPLTIEKDDTLTGITVKQQPAKALDSYEDGQAFDPTGLTLTAKWQTAGNLDVTYSAGNITFKFKDNTAWPATFTVAHSGKTIVAVYQGKEVDLGTLTVAPKTSVDVTVAVTGSITKEYDNTTAVKLPDGVTITYTAPEGYEVDDSAAVYTYADANVDTDKAITVTGLKFDGVATKVNVTNPEALKGDITAVKPTISFDKLSQNAGSVTEVVAKGEPASAAAGDKLVVEYEIPGTPKKEGKPCNNPEHVNEEDHDDTCGWVAEIPAGDPTWETWDTAQAKLNALTDTTKIRVRAYAPTADTVNYLPGSDDDATIAELTITKQTSSGGGAPSTITVRYNVGDYGTLNGDATETVKRGNKPVNVPSVTPVAGYTFRGWSVDGKTVVDPTTVTINSATTFTALYRATYISGYPDGTFRPDAQVSRAEIASMLARLNKDFSYSATYTGNATDVENGAWYANFVNFGMNKGFISGYKDGTFQPDGKITRGEFASMLARYMGLTTGTKQFTDTADHWASDSIAALADAGIVTGYNDGSFQPNSNLTRAEAVQMINTAMKVSTEGVTYDVVPTDVAAAHWAYTQILTAMNTDIRDIVK